MMRRFNCGLLVIALCLLLAPVSSGQELVVSPDQPQGIYQPGETIRWNVQVKGSDVSEAAFVVKKGGLTELTKGKVTLSDGQGQIEAKLDEPGWLLANVSIKPAPDRKVTALGGAPY